MNPSAPLFDSNLGIGIIALMALLIGFLLRTSWRMNVQTETNTATELWKTLPHPISRVFANHKNRQILACLQSYFVGKTLATAVQRGGFIASGTFVVALIARAEVAEWWLTGSLTISEFREFFNIFLLWVIYSFLTLIALHIALRHSSKVTRLEIPRSR